MTRRVIASVAIGLHQELMNLSIFKLQEFGKKHCYELSICRESLDIGRPPAWTKISHILELMKNFDEILWIDSDAIIVDTSLDIISEIHPDTELAWVYHEYENQTHPNSGVMYIRVTINTLKLFRLANEQIDLIDHPWWDQAALMRILGLESQVWPIGIGTVNETIHIKEQKLSVDWNSIRLDPSRKPRIRHFAGEQFWVRKLFMADCANPEGEAPAILQSMLSQHFPIEDDKERVRQLMLANEELRLFNQQIINSRLWTLFIVFRTFRNMKFMRNLRRRDKI